ncbi:MAG TPA: GNAT family N-acetyltransferase [Armatimonadetes bacterium]|nr:GNAT family N-acetyltransferase [Armatimonadota bacterium]
MVIRSPRSSDEVAAQAEVAAAAFGPGALNEPWQDRYRAVEQLFGRDAFLVLEEEGRFVSACTCLPAPVWVGDRRLTLGAVGGVATLPDYRGRGYAGELMRAVVRRMQELGLAASALWPFSYAYYRKFGWDFGCEHRAYRFDPAKIGPLPEPDGVAPFEAGDLPEVVDLFAAYARTLAFCTDRSQRWWRETLRAHGVAPFVSEEQASSRMIICREGGEVVGYALYTPPVGEERRLNARELVASSPEVRLRLLAALAREEPGEIAFRAPADDRFRAQVPDPRQVATTLEPGFAFRIVDPVVALALLPPPPGLRGAIAFTLDDPARPGEILRVTVEASDGELVTSASRTMHSAAPLRLEGEIPSFSQVYTGYLRPTVAYQLGRLKGDAASVAFAEALFPHWTAYRSSIEPG